MFDAVKEALPRFISEKRFDHVCRVADTAAQLAQQWNAPVDQARLAGISHDIAKELTPDSIVEYGVSSVDALPALYQDHPAIWHAFVGPALLEVLFELTDADVHSAVQWHTTGSDSLSMLDQILYVADFIEPGRSHPYVAIITELAHHNMAQATFATAACSIQSLTKRQRTIHPYTQACYNSFMQKIGSQHATTIRNQLDHASKTS